MTVQARRHSHNFFPDEEVRAAFEEFGWAPVEDEASNAEQPGYENSPTWQNPTGLGK